MTTVTNFGMPGIMSGAMPCEGPKAIVYNADFSIVADYAFDLTQQYNQKQFTTLQTLFLDNSQNTVEVIVSIPGTGQTFRIPAKMAGYFPLLAINPPKIEFSSPGSATTVFLALLNFYLPGQTWSVP